MTLKYVRGWRWLTASLAMCALSSSGQGQHLPLLSAPPRDTRPAGHVPVPDVFPASTGMQPSVPGDVAADGREGVENFPDLAPSVYREQEKPKPRQVPVIPEPMLFDLMRPLGAERGELEVNTLVRPSVGRNATGVAWAPEVEWPLPLDTPWRLKSLSRMGIWKPSSLDFREPSAPFAGSAPSTAGRPCLNARAQEKTCKLIYSI